MKISNEAKTLFDSVWAELEKNIGREKISFPKEIIWLNGAPGAGKGTHTEFIRKHRNLPDPVVVSDLLKSPEARKIIDSGALVGDKEVTELVFDRLLAPELNRGVIIDGYPRTQVQAECVSLLFDKIKELSAEQKKENSKFHVFILYIDQKESVARQIQRGQQTIEHNKKVEATGIGEKIPVRATDTDPATAEHRYQTFLKQSYNALNALRDIFPYHVVSTNDTIENVSKKVIAELDTF